MHIVSTGVRALNTFGSRGTSAIKVQGINKSFFSSLGLSRRVGPGKQSV